jgi:hypothetical protein
MSLAPLLRSLGPTIAAGSALLLGALNGCEAPPRRNPPTPAAAAQAAVEVGRVTIVNRENHFVLIDLESNLYVPAPGTPLTSISPTGKTARLKASPEQKRPFIAADILDGEPSPGDRVVR